MSCNLTFYYTTPLSYAWLTRFISFGEEEAEKVFVGFFLALLYCRSVGGKRESEEEVDCVSKWILLSF